MFETDPFAKRERALEDEFFHRVDEKLREQLLQKMEREKAREAITAATGIEDEGLIDDLLDAGFEADTLVSIALVPSVFVAWADGSVTDAERQAVLKAAEERGISEAHVSRHLLENWLESRPPKTLWATWKHYAAAAGKKLAGATSGRLSDEIISHATWVAKASGGVLGIGKISKAEQEILDDVKQTLG